MIKAVFLDVDDTLLDFTKCARASMAQSLGDFGYRFTEEMFDVFTRINTGLWREVEDGTMTREELFTVRWDRIFGVLGIPVKGTDFEARFLTNLNDKAIPVDGAPEAVRYLHTKYTLCVASNASRLQQEARLRHAGMIDCIDFMFTSAEIGYSKPDARFFEKCIASLGGIAPDEIVMIGDSLTADIAGGINAGLKTLWYNPKKLPAPQGRTPDCIISRMSEIKEHL